MFLFFCYSRLIFCNQNEEETRFSDVSNPTDDLQNDTDQISRIEPSQSNKKKKFQIPKYVIDTKTGERIKMPQTREEFQSLPLKEKEFYTMIINDLRAAYIMSQSEENEDTTSALPPNTELDGNGNIVCIDGYYGNDPVGEIGCWKCSSCHIRADCVYPGKCQCADGYEGNGLKCYPPIPQIISVKKHGSSFFVMYGTNSTFVPTIAFCKYSEEMKEAIFFNKTIIQCPYIKSNISISFDQVRWSSIVQMPHEPIPVSFILIPIFFGLLIIKCRRTNKKQDDHEPLIPQHEYTETQLDET